MPKANSVTRVSRRQWAAALTGALVPLADRSQASAAQAPSELDAQRDALRQNQNAIRGVSVPRGTEPAFRFRA